MDEENCQKNKEDRDKNLFLGTKSVFFEVSKKIGEIEKKIKKFDKSYEIEEKIQEKITNSFVISSPKSKREPEKNENSKWNILKNTESFVKKIKFEKKKETGSPRQKTKILNSPINDPKNLEAINKYCDKGSPKQKSKNFNEINSPKNQEHKDSLENKQRNKTIMEKTTESFAKKIVSDRKKKKANTVIGVKENEQKKNEVKVENERRIETSNQEKKIEELFCDEEDMDWNKRKWYRIYIPVKTIDFNY